MSAGKIYGLAPVLEALNSGHGRVQKIIAAEGLKHNRLTRSAMLRERRESAAETRAALTVIPKMRRITREWWLLFLPLRLAM
jgi:hypothetical protein